MEKIVREIFQLLDKRYFSPIAVGQVHMQVDTAAGESESHCWVCHVRAPAGGI